MLAWAAAPAHAAALIPQPRQVEPMPGAFLLDGEVALVAAAGSRVAEAGEFLREAIARDHGIGLRGRPGAHGRTIELRLDPAIAGGEAYRLEVSPRTIELRAADPRGLFWAVQTLRQWLPAGRGRLEVPAVRIDDAPRLAYRGHMLDVARHFVPVESIKRQIDLLSYYKINAFRWHLTDDQGWRIEIRKYPRLTEVGAWRTEPDGSRHGGYYTQAQVREVVEYARRRNVAVIPEIEMPGHASAALVAYPELACGRAPETVPNSWGVFKDVMCVGEERVFGFVADVLDEVAGLFPAPYLHIGGDEAPAGRWLEHAPTRQRMRELGLADGHALQGWFVRRVQQYLAGKGKTLMGWDEILEGGADPAAVVEVWRGEAQGLRALEAGHRIVNAGPFYLDAPPDRLTLETLYRTPVVPPAYAAHAAQVLGAEAPLWTEHVTERNLEPMLYPRLLAFAELAWSAPVAPDYDGFVGRVRAHYPRLRAWNVAYGPESRALVRYRIAREDGGWRLQAERGFDDLRLHYRLDGGEPDADSPWFVDGLLLRAPGAVRVAPFRDGRAYHASQRYVLSAHAALGKPLRWSAPPHRQYRQGGEGMLSDGLFGGDNHADGLWAGWQGEDVQLTLDLQRPIPVQAISTRFLRQSGSWILLPKAVRYYVSLDGRDWRRLYSATPAQDPDDARREVRVLRYAPATPVQARWLRIEIDRYGPLPPGHPGAGSEAFFFLDEVVVE
ncbi:hexosaminidase [Vulcaniibacterium tengchongense]|uniref:beta-N-acetylhexosaminidase n=1 Tax=Vulcaniibacterium tengchongense TaxID=1273429 RepID=A0A3N4VCG2_9GAMM|nr:hexosaminidase [Vulcaniibacterium tengchongense]